MLADEALERLQAGNRRFASAKPSGEVAHRPIAVILGCSDARVPAETVFDQGIGGLFVVRVAGNIAGPSQIGSIEYAAEQLGARLVVVLGHSQCGAVQAALAEVQGTAHHQSSNLRSILDRVRPSVEGLVKSELSCSPDQLMEKAVRANIRCSVDELRHGSETLSRLISEQGLVIVGAEYSLKTGLVEFFEDIHD